ncbi:hypothetical protein IMG5_102250 [Ichthyophthirius multifiliis]|uniref:Lon protease homolog n=1 Tax=Ichthyophthirius multifiliis TaxID=5932 RepID=G0QSM7_ICHMU|nr:hypothetical protein IMG5_102250 [Ichthyophthirius multifiliis]EGR31786.1 hypothetical protein IMG5_102250 [Ichthyophthirius multifiliis]|eukprot:XP_004035272.1 hypothetical protein IMG5_102250 [Ichthyophthirius multifiliis]
MKKLSIYILPIQDRVIYPYQQIYIRIPEIYQYEPKKFNNLIGVLSSFDPQQSQKKLESIENFSKYGTILKITSEDQQYYINTQTRNHREVKTYSAFAFGRFKVISFEKQTPFYIATIELISDEILSKLEQKLKSYEIPELKKQAKKYLENISNKIDTQKQMQIENEQSINKLVYTIASLLEISTETKLQILQADDINERIKLILNIMQEKNGEFSITGELQQKVKSELEKDNKKFLITHKNSGIFPSNLFPSNSNLNSSFHQDESSNETDEISQLNQKIKQKNLPENILQTIQKEFKKLKQMRNSQNAESYVIRTYIETLLDLPWLEHTGDQQDLKQAETILNNDHSGLEKVKKRILEFLAVRFLKGNQRGSIICLCGPPGVGKTSLGKSIADSLGRKFERIALGGVRDESEIRGHRRTYVGALPGMIINAIKRSGSNNPVILLDEIDKLTRDSRGDPSSALLEVLDPNQNSNFVDHYIGLPFDLSNVMFIATANQLDSIQPPLLDRMEIIQIPGYTQEEKKEIAKKYLVKKQIDENGISQEQIAFEDDAIEFIIKKYTREAGVRHLEINVGAVCRSVAVQYSIHKQKFNNQDEIPKLPKVTITQDYVRNVLGVEIYQEDDLVDKIFQPGIAFGMAWTAAGGKLLIIEVSKSVGKGRIEITGQLGDVMKESVKTALGWIKSNLGKIQNLLINQNDFQNQNIFEEIDIHVHFPAAAIPKDGPSAGITIATALISLLTGRKVKSSVSMTGEISLKGRVLPVGGIKEKCIAAYSYGIKTIILPYNNQKDTEEISAEIKQNIEFKFTKTIEEVLDIALEDQSQTDLFNQAKNQKNVNKIKQI